MKALLLAAGLGSRLQPITRTIPKCMVPIQGTPLIDYWLEILIQGGISSILVNLHYLSDQVRNHILKSNHADNVDMVHEAKLLGTGSTLLKNRSWFGNEPLLLIHADNFSFFDLGKFILAHTNRPENCDITMMTFMTDTPQSCGIVDLDKSGVVRQFYEKVQHPPSCLANGAVFILEPRVIGFMERIKKPGLDFCADVLPEFMGRIFTFFNDVYHRDIGTIKSYQQAQKDAPTVLAKFRNQTGQNR